MKASRDEFTVHTIHILEVVDGRDDVNSGCKFSSDLHFSPPHKFISRLL